jgi:nitrate reductase NapE component
MAAVISVASVILIALILWDSFEVLLLPRRVPRNLRLARIFYVYSWMPWSALARRMRPGKRRNTFLSFFGPLSVLFLISLWAVGLVTGFGMLQWALGSGLHSPDDRHGLGAYLYMSGVTFFTLGYGDVTPAHALGRFLAVAETGLGFAFLALVIGYLPVLYQAFSHREVTISLLDARAGSPPTAAQLLLRLAQRPNPALIDRFLEEWERWAAEVLESHVSFPMLSFYRSQHDNQSWIAALTTVLDASALMIACVKGIDPYQAQLTFAMARHVVVDLAQVFYVPPIEPATDRLPEDRLRRLHAALRGAGLELREGAAADARFVELRRMYEPFLNALGEFFLLAVPPVVSDGVPVDNWQTSAWMRRTSGIGNLVPPEPGDDHLD